MAAHGLFEVTGIELEYMIVLCETLAVAPIADRVLGPGGELELGPILCSNELALHVIELKTNGPVRALAGVAEQFQAAVRELDARLEPHGAMLLPGGMHPFMDPYTETRLWPHARAEIPAAFDRIFDCRGHGWSNLQSLQVSLPFRGDDEFARLHAAVRALLPILPALAASSPIADGKPTGLLDTRLEHYRTRAARVPSITGALVPEPLADPTRAGYERAILAPIYRDLAPLDPDGALRHEWANARGAIARFERSTLEIRVLDAAECPAADLAIAQAVIAATRALCDEELSSHAAQSALATAPLANLLRDVIRDGERAQIRDPRDPACARLPAHRLRRAHRARRLGAPDRDDARRPTRPPAHARAARRDPARGPARAPDPRRGRGDRPAGRVQDARALPIRGEDAPKTLT